jgi:serine/threonine protein kinase
VNDQPPVGDAPINPDLLNLRVGDAFAEWFDLYREDEGADKSAFLAAQDEILRESLSLRIDEHLSVSALFKGAEHRVVSGLLIDGDFELVRELGAGASAVVWEAHQRSLNRRVAIKFLRLPLAVLSERSMERFKREGLILAGVRHPGIASVYVVGTFGAVPYLIQELILGAGTLRDLLHDLKESKQAGEALSRQHYRRVAAWIKDVAQALSAVHKAGILHRDIKPANILLGEDGRARLIDFGLALIGEEGDLTREGETLGTLLYMNPEQLMGLSGEVDERSEVFSLGVCLYEALTFERPFRGDTDAQIFQKIVHDDPQDPRALHSKVPDDLAAVVTKMLEKRPMRRYQGMDGVCADLDAFLLGDPVSATYPSKSLQSWRWIRRRPLVLVSFILSIALSIALAFSTYLLSRISANALQEQEQAQVFADLSRRLSYSADFFDSEISHSGATDSLGFSADASGLYELCKNGSEALLPMRANGFEMLIGACLVKFDHIGAGKLLAEVVALELEGRLNHSLSLYQARVYAMRWQDAQAAYYFERALNLLASSVDENSSVRDLEQVEEEIQFVLTEFIIAAVGARDEHRLLAIRAEFGDPEELLQARYDFLRETLADSHPDVCEVRFAEGLLLTFFREYPEAVKHWQSLYSDAKNSSAFGEDHPFTLRAQHELAYNLVYTDEVERGVELFHDALERWELRSVGARQAKHKIDTLVPRWRLAWAYLEWFNPSGDPELWKADFSEENFREVIADMKESFGDDAVVTLQAMTGFSVLLSRTGQFDEAISLMEATYETKSRSEVLGPLNVSTLISLRALYQAEKELMLFKRSSGDLVAAAEVERSFCEHFFKALEAQMEREAFSKMKDVESGLSNYERCIEFTGFGACLIECSDGIASSFAPERVRHLTRFLVDLVEPSLQVASQLVSSRELTAEYLKRHDPSLEGQRLVRELLNK